MFNKYYKISCHIIKWIKLPDLLPHKIIHMSVKVQTILLNIMHSLNILPKYAKN